MTTAPKLIREQLLALEDSFFRRAMPPQHGRWTEYEKGRSSAFEAARDELMQLRSSLAAEPVGGEFRWFTCFNCHVETYDSPAPNCPDCDMPMVQQATQPDSAEGEDQRLHNEFKMRQGLAADGLPDAMEELRGTDEGKGEADAENDYQASIGTPCAVEGDPREQPKAEGGYQRCDCDCPNGLKHIDVMHDDTCAMLSAAPQPEQVLGRCCYGGMKTKSNCASCAAWTPGVAMLVTPSGGAWDGKQWTQPEQPARDGDSLAILREAVEWAMPMAEAPESARPAWFAKGLALVTAEVPQGRECPRCRGKGWTDTGYAPMPCHCQSTKESVVVSEAMLVRAMLAYEAEVDGEVYNPSVPKVAMHKALLAALGGEK